jgi:hypothetical protein
MSLRATAVSVEWRLARNIHQRLTVDSVQHFGNFHHGLSARNLVRPDKGLPHSRIRNIALAEHRRQTEHTSIIVLACCLALPNAQP